MVLRTLPASLAAAAVLAGPAGLADAVTAGSAPGGAGRMAVVPASRRTIAPLDARARLAGLPVAVDGAVRRGRRLIASITI
jgi:hypothetical protein